jgi:hypothetical protein
MEYRGALAVERCCKVVESLSRRNHMGIIRTFYFVIPFVVSAGNLVPIEAFQCKSAEQAVKRAQLLSDVTGVVGAAAFSRIGDLEAGVFDDVVAIKTFGEVPEKVLASCDLEPKDRPNVLRHDGCS